MNAPTYPAAFAVHTVQGITHACHRHASTLVNLMRFMGANSLPMPLDVNDQHECSNCVNEAKSKAGSPA